MKRRPLARHVRWAALVLPLLLFSACGKRVCPDDMVQDPLRSKPGKIVYCAGRADPGRALWIQLWDDGTRRQVCPFLGGRPGGSFQAFHKGGARWLEGRYLNGVKTGRWDQWGQDGKPVANGEYREGALIQGAPVGSPATCESVVF